MTARPSRKIKKSRSKQVLKVKKNLETLLPYTGRNTEMQLRQGAASSFSHAGEYYGALDLSDKRSPAPPIIDYNTGIFEVNAKSGRNGFKRSGSLSNNVIEHSRSS